MPKIIENLRENLLAETKRQILHDGYSTVTVRSVAKGCGVGVGTVYNYFASKDAMTAAFMLKDWKERLAAIDAVSRYSQDAEPVARCIFDQLREFSGEYHSLFQDQAASSAFAGSFSKYHVLLRSQLAQPLRKFCGDDFSAEFLAEALLTWTMAGKAFEELYPLLNKIL